MARKGCRKGPKCVVIRRRRNSLQMGKAQSHVLTEVFDWMWLLPPFQRQSSRRRPLLQKGFLFGREIKLQLYPFDLIFITHDVLVSPSFVASQGLNTGTRAFSKSFRLRVTIVRP
jgi:hypothetical protein